MYHIAMFARLGINTKAARVFGLLSFSGLALLWVFSVWRFYLSPDYIPLHYTVYFGFDRFGPRYDVFLFATIGTIILVVNAAVGAAMFKEHPLWQALWWAKTTLLEVILMAAIVLAVLKSFS